MRGIAQDKVVSGNILLGVLLIGLLALPVLSQSSGQQSEAEIYAEWYEAFGQKDYFKVIDLAITYVIQYPSGQYAKFLKRAVGPLADEIPRPDNSEESAGKRLDNYSVKRRNFLKSLMEKSGDVNESLKDGKTLLMLAAANGDVEAVKALLEKGAVINTVEKAHGWTALVYAVWNSEINTIKALLEKGADVEIKDAEGRTIFEHAKLAGDPKVKAFFKSMHQKR